MEESIKRISQKLSNSVLLQLKQICEAQTDCDRCPLCQRGKVTQLQSCMTFRTPAAWDTEAIAKVITEQEAINIDKRRSDSKGH